MRCTWGDEAVRQARRVDNTCRPAAGVTEAMPARCMRASTARLADTMPTPDQAPHCTLLPGTPAYGPQTLIISPKDIGTIKGSTCQPPTRPPTARCYWERTPILNPKCTNITNFQGFKVFLNLAPWGTPLHPCWEHVRMDPLFYKP